MSWDADGRPIHLFIYRPTLVTSLPTGFMPVYLDVLYRSLSVERNQSSGLSLTMSLLFSRWCHETPEWVHASLSRSSISVSISWMKPITRPFSHLASSILSLSVMRLLTGFMPVYLDPLYQSLSAERNQSGGHSLTRKFYRSFCTFAFVILTCTILRIIWMCFLSKHLEGSFM